MASTHADIVAQGAEAFKTYPAYCPYQEGSNEAAKWRVGFQRAEAISLRAMNAHPHRYSTKLTFKGKRASWPGLRGQIFEGDVLIGTFARATPGPDGFIPPFTWKFYSSQAAARFEDFADCLSIGESIEALTAGQ